MIKHAISVLAFFFVTMAVQAGSHFVINVDHYYAIEFMRSEPIMPLGIAAIIIQAIIMSLLTQHLSSNHSSRIANSIFKTGIIVSLSFGAFLSSYILLASPAKYSVSDIPQWILVEGSASLIQFSIFGVLLGIIHDWKNDTLKSAQN